MGVIASTRRQHVCNHRSRGPRPGGWSRCGGSAALVGDGRGRPPRRPPGRGTRRRAVSGRSSASSSYTSGMPVGMFSPAIVVVVDAVQVLDQRAQRVAVRRHQHHLAVPQVRHDRRLPVRQHPRRPRRPGTRCAARRRRGRRTAGRRPGENSESSAERRRRDVVGAAPEHELLLAVLLQRLLLVLALQRAVVPLVQPPAARAPGSSAGRRRRARGSRCVIARRSSDVCTTSGSSPRSREQLAAARGLRRPLARTGRTSTQPVNRFLAFHSLSPWRSRTQGVRRVAHAEQPIGGGLEPRAGAGTPPGCGSTRRARPATPTPAASS